jgi:hypothetical protein
MGSGQGPQVIADRSVPAEIRDDLVKSVQVLIFTTKLVNFLVEKGKKEGAVNVKELVHEVFDQGANTVPGDEDEPGAGVRASKELDYGQGNDEIADCSRPYDENGAYFIHVLRGTCPAPYVAL